MLKNTIKHFPPQRNVEALETHFGHLSSRGTSKDKETVFNSVEFVLREMIRSPCSYLPSMSIMVYGRVTKDKVIYK